MSFYEFVRLITTPSQTERLEKVIREVRRIPELAHQQEGLDSVRNMITLLQNEAEKVMRTNQRLSATLRRLLDVRAHAERQRIAKLLQDIQVLAADYAGASDSSEIGMCLDLEMAIDMPFRRTFWIDPPRFVAVNLTGFVPDPREREAAFQQVADMKRLNWHEMRDRIRHMLTVENAPTLRELLEVHPAEAGVIEVIGYIQIAAEDGHQIEPRCTETVVVTSVSTSNSSIMVTIPRVTFVPERSNGHAK